jgi:hypothetical protein
MTKIVKQYYHDISINKNQLLNSRLQNLSTSQRIILGTTLTIDDKGFQVYDTNYLAPYWWDGHVWLTSGGIVEWGSISGNLFVQDDLITYLQDNYYSVSNPNKYISGLSITTNKITKWGSNDTTITDSIITDNGTSITIAGNSITNGTSTLNGIVTINKILPSGSTLFKINSGASSLGSQFEFKNYSDAGLLKIGYFGNTGNRIELDGGSDNNGSRISLYEKIGSSAPTLNIFIDARTGGFTYFNAGNFLIGKTINSTFKLDVVGNTRVAGYIQTDVLYTARTVTDNIQLNTADNLIFYNKTGTTQLMKLSNLGVFSLGLDVTRLEIKLDTYWKIQTYNAQPLLLNQISNGVVIGGSTLITNTSLTVYGSIATDSNLVGNQAIINTNLILSFDTDGAKIQSYATKPLILNSIGNNVVVGGTSSNSSALLQLTSTSKGFLKPKMTNTQMLAIASPSTGLEVFNTTTNQSYFYNGTIWVPTGTIQFATTSTYAAMVALGTPSTPTLIKVANDENKSATRTMYVWFPDGNRQYLLQINDN